MLNLMRFLRFRPMALVAAGGVVIEGEVVEDLPKPLARVPRSPLHADLKDRAEEIKAKLGYGHLKTALKESEHLNFLAEHGVLPFDPKTVEEYKINRQKEANADSPRGYRYEWSQYALSGYEKPVPLAILEKAMELKAAWDARLPSDATRLGSQEIDFRVDTLMANRVVEDPFLMVKFGYGEWHYIAVWDEPGFGV